MKTITAKINLMIFLIFSSAFGFGYIAFLQNKKVEALHSEVSESLLMRDEVKKLDHRDRGTDVLKKLKVFKAQLPSGDRDYAASNLIQAYNANNDRLFENRVKEFEHEEQKFFKVSQWLIKKHKKQTQFYLLLATLLPFIGLLTLTYYLYVGILSPLQALSKRMMEFLIDQYSFRFSSPADNEIGNLERTFNSLAQKVLNNMDELLALDRAKSEFVSIASHELRTPLTSIKGSLGLLSSEIVGKLDESAKEMVNVAEQETDRLVRLINEMLDLAKIESRSLSLKKTWVPVEDLLLKSAQAIQGFATAAQVHIKVECIHQKMDCMVDSDRIQQVITNLISNAIKFSSPESEVILRSTLNEFGILEFSVNDQGPGISEENQKLIFEKFRQATDSSTHLVKGTGLGLAISKALVEEHGGEIGVRSIHGQGSTFYFTIKEWRPLTAESLKLRKVA